MQNLDRRGLLAAILSGAAPFARPAHAANGMWEVEFLVIGAGAAGLTAARLFQRHGRTFQVLEARPRIGGRAWTTRTASGVEVDMGAAWLHVAHENPWLPIARKLGVEVRRDTPDGAGLFRGGGRLPGETERRYLSGMDRFPGLVRSGLRHRADRPLSQIGSTDPIEAFARGIAAFAMGEDPEAISARDLAGLGEGDDYAVPSGVGHLVARFGADVPVRLNAPVERLEWSSRGVVARGAFGALRARACLVTVPPSVLAAGGLVFAPDLPPERMEAIAALKASAFSKIFIPRPAADLPVYAIALSRFEAGLRHVLYSPPGGPVSALLIGGDLARDVERSDESAVGDLAVAVVTEMAGSDAGRRVRVEGRSRWVQDPFALGSYTSPAAGHAGARDVYASPFEKLIYFAGEASPGRQAVTLGGAHRAGAAAARRMTAEHV